MMKGSAFLAMLMVAGTIGCSPTSSRTLDPVTVSDDFMNPDASTVAEYRKAWDGTTLTELDRATVAGELLQADPSRYATYFAFLKGAIGSSDESLGAAVANSLRNAHGEEALDILVDAATSGRPQIARAAGHALAYKRQEVAGGSIVGSEADLVEDRIQRVCEHTSLPSYVRELICS